ncbi:MAG: HTH domain-containing protein [Planctomycetales bacterium]
MVRPAVEKISFIELAQRVIENVGKPMSAAEIWATAQQTGLAERLQSTGKTPEASLGARLYTDVQKPTSPFVKVGARPARFLLKSLAASIPDLQQHVAAQPTPQVKQQTYKERELHPLLVWFADGNFGAHCRTIRHEKSLKKGEKQNQWIHPDVVGFALTTKDWTHEVVQLVQSSGGLPARLYSFEVKVTLDFLSLREYFFQAVSNSSWAHEGYLVAADIDEDPDFRAELTRLSQSFGIGVIQLKTTDPLDSALLLAAREKTEIDWKTVDRIAAVNPDFEDFIGSVAKSVKINQPAVNNFDKLLSDAELELHLKRITGR